MHDPHPLETILQPTSIVIAGASSNPLKMGSLQAANALHGGFKGTIQFLHPKETEIFGRPARPKVAELPEKPDMALITTPTDVSLDILEDLGANGVRHAVITTAGFREVRGGGFEKEKRLVEIAEKYGMHFVGPNCIGVLNTHHGLNLTVFPYKDKPGGLSLVSQSGTYVSQTLVYLQRRGIRMSKSLSVGNSTSLDLVDCLEYLEHDDETRAIALYIEGLPRGRRFMEVAREITRKKPIVALYIGGTEAGARSGLSHTGSMGGEDALVDGVFAQAGVLRARSTAELFGWGHALATMPPPRGPKVAILTHSGGPATSMADTCERSGLQVPELSEELQEKLRADIPPTGSTRNPIDLTFSLDFDAFARRLPKTVLGADEIDAVLLHGMMDTSMAREAHVVLGDFLKLPVEMFVERAKQDFSPFLKALRESGKPLTASTFLREDGATDQLVDGGVPVYDHPEEAARAMAALYRFGRIQARETDWKASSEELPPHEETGETEVMDDAQAFGLLEQYGVPVVKFRTVQTLKETLRSGASLGFPLVLKGLVEGVLHKSDEGLVVAGIQNQTELADAWQDIDRRCNGCMKLISPMIPGDREIVIGMKRSPGFGPAVMLGIGGLFTEAIRDVTFRLAPLSPGEARSMPDSLKAAGLLEALRGQEAINLNLLERALVGVGRLALERPDIVELDINPLIIDKKGNLVAVDALILTGKN